MALMPAVMNSSRLHRALLPAPHSPVIPAGTGHPQDLALQELKDTAGLQLLGHQDGEQQVPGCSPATRGDDAGVTEPALSPIPPSPSPQVLVTPRGSQADPNLPRYLVQKRGRRAACPPCSHPYCTPQHPRCPGCFKPGSAAGTEQLKGKERQLAAIPYRHAGKLPASPWSGSTRFSFFVPSLSSRGHAKAKSKEPGRGVLMSPPCPQQPQSPPNPSACPPGRGLPCTATARPPEMPEAEPGRIFARRGRTKKIK